MDVVVYLENGDFFNIMVVDIQPIIQDIILIVLYGKFNFVNGIKNMCHRHGWPSYFISLNISIIFEFLDISQACASSLHGSWLIVIINVIIMYINNNIFL